VFKFKHPIEVRFRDIDAFHHVNNAVYLTYLEQARVMYLRGIDLFDPSHTMILARNEVDYRKAVFLGDQLEVWTRVSKIGHKSLEFQYELHANDVLCASASSVHVWYDFESNQSQPVPLEVRDVLERFEGRSLTAQ
jgi:acyl-CoA thioester hydrolase